MLYGRCFMEWSVCFTDNCCNDYDALMDTGICQTTIISLYYYYRYTSGNVDDTVILLDDTVIVFLLKS